MRIVEVEWEDCCARHGWLTKVELQEFLDDREWMVRTLGYVQADDEKGIVIIESVPLNETEKPTGRLWGCVTHIPRSAIRKVTELRPAIAYRKAGKARRKR